MGILQGTGTGAAIGSAIPGIGTAAGAIAGGIIGLGQSIGGWISGKNKEKKQREPDYRDWDFNTNTMKRQQITT